MRFRSAGLIWACALLAACVTTINPFDDPANATDRDGDGFGDLAEGGTDCNDADANIHPEAPEVCGDAVDNNCDGAIDDTGQGSVTWFQDSDGDGYGNPDVRTLACPGSLVGDGFTVDDTDCDDTRSSVNPGVTVDVCNALDDDCDDTIDEDEAASFGGHAFDSLKTAFARAIASDAPAVVEVCGGPEAIEVHGLTVESPSDLTLRSDPEGSQATLVQPQGGNIIRVREGARLTLQDLRLTGSTASPAVIAEGTSELNLLDTTLSSNPAGALRIDGTGKKNTLVILTNTILSSNGKSSIDGGGMAASGHYHLEIIDSTVAQNRAGKGAGAHLVGPGAEVFVTGSRFEGNEADEVGGAMVASGIGLLAFTKTTLIDNEAGDGGGLWLLDSELTGDGSSAITQNHATTEGGGVYLRNSLLSGLQITENSAATGGGAFVDDVVDTTAVSAIHDSTVQGNTANAGGGIAVEYGERSTLVTSDTILLDNVATESAGGIYVDFAVGQGGALQVRKGQFQGNNPADIEIATGFSCDEPAKPTDFDCSWAGCTVCEEP